MKLRRPARARTLVASGALLALLACALPWGRTADATGMLPVLTYGFDGPGFLAFLAAALALALVALPWAAERSAPPLDGPLPLVAVTALGAVGVLLRAVQLLNVGVLGLPDRSPGLWLAGLGIAVMSVGVAQLLPERRSA